MYLMYVSLPFHIRLISIRVRCAPEYIPVFERHLLLARVPTRDLC